ncbi:unnamed protein product [Peronospora belbahrii]|uniref:Kinesin motor domain-containing protein n=1 Tax=Peronospora belbahrii TaxID=622444 RepID=A0AAU9L268_9STRA|nr:unnamed protein product [Peronospora belbahrii]
MDTTNSARGEAENIAVCIRIRPMNDREIRSNDSSALCCIPRLKTVSLLDPRTGIPLSGKGNVYQYDDIFDPKSDIHLLYQRVGQRIVHSTLNGINGTIFAYGQTSSGKTFTMQGNGEMNVKLKDQIHFNARGILQLAVDDIFHFIENCLDRDFLLRVSYVEIYNEVVKDLLNPVVNLKLREDPKKGVYVECKEEIITNYHDIVMLLQMGNRNRTVGHTAMNEKSSRSHSVFRIVIESKEKANFRRLSEEDVNGAVLVASLNLVDLAGSESLRHTGAEGIRQREAGNINKSLLTLARVINSLASSGGGGQNAPFRDSKLTRLLQNSLGGNTRTLIICCVTPSDKYIEETKSTLQFAARAKDIQTSATVNEVLDDQTQLRRLKREVHELKKLVNSEALNALKAENEALISEKNHNKTEMARLTGLILSSSSVTKLNTGSKKRKRQKGMRETWGPGDFPTNIKALGLLSPDCYPRKRHSPTKENMDPQTLFRVYEDVEDVTDVNNDLAKAETPASYSATNKLKLVKRADVGDSSKNVIDLFSAVFRSYHDGNGESPIAAVEATANEKRALLGGVENARASDVLAEIKSLMVANMRLRDALDDKSVLDQTVNDLLTKVEDENADWDSSKSALNAGINADEVMAELMSTQEYLAKEKRRCHDLEMEKANTQQMAAEELNSLHCQLEALKLESTKLQQGCDRKKHELAATAQNNQSGLMPPGNEDSMSSCSRKHELESLLEELKALQTSLQLAVAERDEEIASLELHGNEVKQPKREERVRFLEEKRAALQKKIGQLREEAAPGNEDASSESAQNLQRNVFSADKTENVVVDKLAQELQNIMQELAQLQSDHERTALEKEELQAERERMSEEIEVLQRQLCVISETLVEKEHIAKVLQAQLDAKVATISQMQTKHLDEVETLQQSIRDLATEKEQLSTRIREAGAADSTTTDSGDPEELATKCIDNANEHSLETNKTQKLHLAVERMAEQLSALESKLGDTNPTLCSTEHSAEQNELMIAFDQLKVDFHTMQQASTALSTDFVVKQEQIAKASSPDDPNIVLTHGFEQQYSALKEDFKRVTKELEHISHERNDCMEELQALEAQLMQISEEKMKFAIAADEQENKLREVQKEVLSSSATITTLQAQLEDTQSIKASLEADKMKLEQTIENLQIALTTSQADHAAIVEQMQHDNTVPKPENESSASKAEYLQQRLETEFKEREKLQLDVQSYEETLSVLRNEAKDNSDKIADLSEKIKMLEADLDSAARTQQKKDKEFAKLTNALTMSEEEQQEMRHQSKQRLIAAEEKEMELQDKISALKLQLKMASTGMETVSTPPQDDVELNLLEARAKQTELQSKTTALETQLLEAKQELLKRDSEWSKKEALAKKEFARMTTEQTQLLDELSALKTDIGASQDAMKVQAEELVKAKEFCAAVLEQKEVIQRKLEAETARWEETHQDLVRQMDSIGEQFLEAQAELERHQKNADGEIHRLRSAIDQSEAEINELKRCAKAREEDWKIRICEQEEWQKQVNSRQEALQAKCNELVGERRLLKEKYVVIEAQHREVEDQQRDEICELQQKFAAAQAQQATYQAKLKEIEAQLEMTENEVTQSHRELKSLAELLKSSQMEGDNYHNQLVEAQLAKESLEKLVDKQKARIDKLDKVKMTTETLELFRKLKKDRFDLHVKVQDLQKDLAQALSQCQGDHLEQEHFLLKRKDEELRLLKEQVEELREAVRIEKHQALDGKAKMRAALIDEHQKAEHEVQEMQFLMKERMELVDKLESQLASANDAMTTFREHTSENVAYLEKENLELHVENRKLKKQLNVVLTSLPEKEDVMDDDTGTYDVSAAAAAKVLGEDISSSNKENEVGGDCAVTTKTSSQPPEKSRCPCY